MPSNPYSPAALQVNETSRTPGGTRSLIRTAHWQAALRLGAWRAPTAWVATGADAIGDGGAATGTATDGATG